MTTLTSPEHQQPVVRDLPPGHDDPASPWWIDADLRDAYQRYQVTDDLAPALQKRTEERRQQRLVEAWERYRARKQRTLGEYAYQGWLRHQTTAAGRPRPKALRDLPEDLRESVGSPGLDGAEIAETVHQVVLTAVTVRRDKASADAASRAVEEKRRTCTICGVVSPSVAQQPMPKPNGRRGTVMGSPVHRVCSACHLLLPIVAAAVSHPGRLDALLRYAAALAPDASPGVALADRLNHAPQPSPSDTGRRRRRGSQRRR